MSKILLTLLAAGMLPIPLTAGILINEVHHNPTGPDSNYEFIELKSTTNGIESLAGLTLVLINSARSDEGEFKNPGEILEVLDLSELSTGSNGLLLLGNGYTDFPRGGPWSGVIDPATAVADPDGLGNADIKTNTGINVLLIRNYNTAAGPPGTDLDKDVIAGANAVTTGNGIIDWQQNPPPAGASPPLWANGDVVDSIGTLDYPESEDPIDSNSVPGYRRGYLPASATLNTTWSASSLGQRDPDTWARQLANDTPHHAASYYGAKMPRTTPTPTDIIYRAGRTFGPGGMVGQVTPGRANLSTSLPPTEFRLNEVGFSGPRSFDNRFQYVEIINVDGQSRSLGGYWLLLVDSFDALEGPPGVGTIMQEWNLSEFATGSNGLLLLGDGFSPGFTPFQNAVHPMTHRGDPAARVGPPSSSGWSVGELKFKKGFTLLLVEGYAPPVLKDLDSNPEDGLLDITPWDRISDQIGYTQESRITVGRTYAAVDLRSVMDSLLTPHNLSRKAGNLDNSPATATTAWYGGRFPGGASAMNLGFEESISVNPGAGFTSTWFGGFRGAATPGQPNLSGAIDPAAPPLGGSIRINEVMLNPTNVSPGDDQANEYIELIGTNGGIAHLEGLYVLVIDLSGNRGNIRTGFPMAGYTTGLNGIVLVGDGYDNSNQGYLFSDGPLPANSAAFDPPTGMEGSDLPNEGCAILLVRGIRGPIVLNPNGRPVGDLDPENDGVLLSPVLFTDELVDSIAVSPVSPGPAYGWLDSSPFMPGHLARYPGNLTASSSGSWYSGQIPQQGVFPSTNYTGSFSGSFRGAASPGRLNHGATPGPLAHGVVVFNEVHLNPPGADGNFEFLELLATNETRRSLNGYSILRIDNTGSNTGAIRQAWSLDGFATGTNGLLLIGNGYTNPDSNPWASRQRLQTANADPPGEEGLDSSLNDADLGSDNGNSGILLLLVRNFTGFIGTDLDQFTTDQVETDADGIFDVFPWEGGVSGILDSVLLRDYVPTVPAPPVPLPPYPYDGWSYGIPDLTAAFFPSPSTLFYHPKTFARFRGETMPNEPGSWYGGDLTGGLTGKNSIAEEYVSAGLNPMRPPRPDGFRGRVTPGQPNLMRQSNADPDGDGLVNLVEEAINSNPQSNNAGVHPHTPSVIIEDNQSYFAISYPRIRGGGPDFPYAAEAYSYLLETSPDCVTWTPDPGTGPGSLIPVGIPFANPDGVTETVSLRLPAPVTSPAGRQYIRLRVNRR